MELKTVNKHGREYLVMPDGVGIPFKVPTQDLKICPQELEHNFGKLT